MDSPSSRNSSSSLCRSPLARARHRRWRQSRTGTAVVVVAALVLSTSAWLSLVFSGTTARCWHRFRRWEAGPHSFPWKKRHSSSSYSVSGAASHPSIGAPPPPPPPPPEEYPPSSKSGGDFAILPPTEELRVEHIVFGIAGSSQLWERRKEFVRLWWRGEKGMRGHVWLEEQVGKEEWDQSLPKIMISEDTSRFRYTNPTGHPSGLRIARIVLESFRLGLPDVRWFVLGDDDTIFDVDNLVGVLSKYDPSHMLYVGSPSESHSANTYFSHNMAYGGGGIAISYPLARALSSILDHCIDTYHNFYGSDDRLHACISELGVPLTREPGFHQTDVRGNAYGLLSSHPIAPFVSIHHVEAVDPFYPGLTTLDSLKRFTKAMSFHPMAFLQRSICYDGSRRLSFSVSLGYVVQVFPEIIPPRQLDSGELTYSAWNRISHRNEFDLDTRDPQKSICKRPVLFFLEDLTTQGNITVGSYLRVRLKDDLKRKVFCFPRSPPLPYVERIQVLGYPLSKNWHLVPRRLCSKLNKSTEKLLTISVEQCGKGSLGSFVDVL
ncbi:hypothetical protein Tsubulata_042015 [Turnera subulata]|uniref:Uncharacterized protein n=1 Tax=Turnera subulata TaxID=218843 RepID=A0A9Q0F5F7_9ROSI|nr:hypothetical protein Tsubulata_042015 [Turnera subulata]